MVTDNQFNKEDLQRIKELIQDYHNKHIAETLSDDTEYQWSGLAETTPPEEQDVQYKFFSFYEPSCAGYYRPSFVGSIIA